MKSLTPMQAASWVGRQSPLALGGVAAHLYAEFDGGIVDLPRFREAVAALYARHPMLRLRLTDDGQQRVVAECPPPKIDDLRNAAARVVRQRLAEKRRRMENQQLLRDTGRPCEISLTLLPDNRSRLHIDLDMIAADAQSFRIVVEDLARFYAAPPRRITPVMDVAWFHYLEQRAAAPHLAAARERDRAWWQARLAALAPAPRLPCPGHACRSRRLAVRLNARSSRALRDCARRHHLTLSALFLSLFTLTLTKALAQPSLRINVPTFFRDPNLPGGRETVGDFTDLLLFSGELRPERSLLQHCEHTMAQLHELIGHAGYSGISVMRDLSRLHGTLQYSPIVFTAGFGIAGETLFSRRAEQQLGKLAWVTSQGPQVALDVQLAWLADEILINWDIRADAFLPEQPGRMFRHFHELAARLALAPHDITQPVARWLAPGRQPPIDTPTREEKMAQPLTPLQQAYLLGRSEQWPLGGVAMHDFRSFRGPLDPVRFRARLAELIAHFAALRTVIDVERQQQSVLESITPPLEEHDLRDSPPDAAEEQIHRLRQRYRQYRHDPASPPWRIVLIALPGGEEYLIFTSFDALILDGQGISWVIARLFDDRPLGRMAADNAPPPSADTPARERARAWWRDALAEATPPRLPWRQPLEEIVSPRWRREECLLDADVLKRLTRPGAAQGLFANSVLSTIVLDTLALWTEDETLLVGVPVILPDPAQQPANRSTFIAVRYRRGDALPESAHRLQEAILGGLQHTEWSGVDLARQLTSRESRGPALPVILTNGMAWETLPAGSPLRQEEGLTQTPQVALDIRLICDAGRNLLLTADFVEQALAPEQIREMLDAIRRRMALIVEKETLMAPVRDALAYAHYQANSPLSAAVEYDFLGHIARNLFSAPRNGTALICGEMRWSWTQLGERVASVANGLLARGLTPGSVVAIYLPRCPEHVVISIACALLGLIRVPVDINSPARRTQYLLENCRPNLTICREATNVPGAVTPQSLETENPIPPAFTGKSDDQSPAYYLYTSGTTGKPKCVALHNRATANVLGQTLASWAVSDSDVFLSVTPLHHDMSVFDLFAPLCVGATLVLPAEHQEKDAISWSRLVAQHRVTLWCSVPAILKMLLDCASPEQLASLRLIAQGGDYIKPSVIQRLRAASPTRRLISLGGPTETTIWSIWHEVSASDVTHIPYGRPLAGNCYFICHDGGEHCPRGVPGRIYTAGVNLACGYVEDGELVQHDFVEVVTPQGSTIRSFRTGDIGCYREDGAILFAGRIGGYVKIRGVRVSLPEIEEALRQHEAIRDVVVVDYAPGGGQETELGAVWLAADDRQPTVAELRAFAQRYLPCTHIPARFITRERFPLSANGKIDRHTLRAELAGLHGTPSAAPGVPAERASPQRKILAIYCTAIGLTPRPEWNDEVPFTAMGLKLSHLNAVRERLHAELGLQLSGAELMKCKNVRDVCALLP
ncbi:amino acid adenylation domain-containing protein [Intestinirhabdus alba]|jgi:nonribosomal peptide synthetase VibF|uniref:Amino acid adenylation domain-containing protein n=1 Tax=Intestinirhabdus alba TaxID=2899544 RepID=A0A6L6IIY7_9ENTR|nr:amino acid adenylation domain-containing protein [Intestinirhabdus alba]MTH46801.1 amino acid adenylation domain-containing protein [Intestinirhabdus alba]